LESAYEACLAYEFRSEGLKVLTQVPLPLVYREVRLDAGYRLDLLVEDLVVVEIKAVDALVAIHQAQVISYLRLSGKKLGILINSIACTFVMASDGLSMASESHFPLRP
jgi:GxxExxY protein